MTQNEYVVEWLMVIEAPTREAALEIAEELVNHAESEPGYRGYLRLDAYERQVPYPAIGGGDDDGAA